MYSNYKICNFVSVLKVNDAKDKVIKMKNRYSASFIFPLSGKIEFEHNNTFTYADILHPVYVPRGIDYTNRCVETAQSILFNIYDINGFNTVTHIPSCDTAQIIKFYNRINDCGKYPESIKNLYAMSYLYKLVFTIYANESKKTNPLIENAVAFMEKNYYKPQLSLANIADSVHISTVYLGKLFSNELKTTPFKDLTKIRMKRAADYLREMRSISEIAKNTGYGDIYQFSRAFKRFYGCSPKNFFK